MSATSAQQNANEVTMSDAEQIAWWATSGCFGLTKTITPAAAYIGFIGLMNGIQRGDIAAAVRKLTVQNQKLT